MNRTHMPHLQINPKVKRVAQAFRTSSCHPWKTTSHLPPKEPRVHHTFHHLRASEFRLMVKFVRNGTLSPVTYRNRRHSQVLRFHPHNRRSQQNPKNCVDFARNCMLLVYVSQRRVLKILPSFAINFSRMPTKRLWTIG